MHLTADGNYAIAENVSDEVDSQEDHANDDATMMVQTQDDESYIVPDIDNKALGYKVSNYVPFWTLVFVKRCVDEDIFICRVSRKLITKRVWSPYL